MVSFDNETMALIQWGAVISTSLAAAITDLKGRRIPNVLTMPLLAAGFVWAGYKGGLTGIGDSAAACLLLAFPFVFLFIFAGGGAGDAKLMAAIGAWVGLKESVVVLGCVTAAGIALAVFKAIVSKRIKLVFNNVIIALYTMVFAVLGRKMKNLSFEHIEKSEKLTIPYGTAIFAGVCIAGGIVLL